VFLSTPHSSEMKVTTSHLHYMFETKPGLRKNGFSFFSAAGVGSQRGHFCHRYICSASTPHIARDGFGYDLDYCKRGAV
jgi:hypothetical protein